MYHLIIIQYEIGIYSYLHTILFVPESSLNGKQCGRESYRMKSINCICHTIMNINVYLPYECEMIIIINFVMGFFSTDMLSLLSGRVFGFQTWY